MPDENSHLPSPPAAPARAPDNHQAASGNVLGNVRDFVWPKSPPHSHRQGEGFREIVETVVFVVVLVLLLKSFVAEAFVIPTGSMADTLWGYQKVVSCPQCSHQFPVNASHEVDPQDGGPPLPVTDCLCPNCRLRVHLVNPGRDGRDPSRLASNEILDPGWNSGDRVLVVKYLYDFHKPDLFDVVVFKYPSGPQKDWVQMNYIKRLVGLGGDTVGIWYGDLYKWRGEQPTTEESDPRRRDLWKTAFMHENEALGMLQEGNAFGIVRKPPEKVLAMQRLVYDNDQPAKDLEGVLPPRWAGEEEDGWARAGAHGFRHTPSMTERPRWLRYRHLLRPTPPAKPEDIAKSPAPELITDFLAYNTYFPKREDMEHHGPVRPHRLQEGPRPSPPNWVGDLILECEVTSEDGQGEFTVELSRGVDRFRARWDLSSGQCTLLRLKRPHEGSTPPADDDFEPLDKEKGAALTALKGKGTHRLRFANVDAQLIVWVDGSLVFGQGLTYEPATKRGPYPNDLEPASIGVKGGTVGVQQLKLWRDTYYTTNPGMADGSPEDSNWSDPKKWLSLQRLQGRTFFIQPGHYLCLGDNSPESSDSRAWGAVPERLMLGRALAVYYPFAFPLWPLKSPVNRVGAIR